jgi:hypothetical protein
MRFPARRRRHNRQPSRPGSRNIQMQTDRIAHARTRRPLCVCNNAAAARREMPDRQLSSACSPVLINLPLSVQYRAFKAIDVPITRSRNTTARTQSDTAVRRFPCDLGYRRKSAAGTCGTFETDSRRAGSCARGSSASWTRVTLFRADPRRAPARKAEE